MSGDKEPRAKGPGLAWDGGGPLGWFPENSVSWYHWRQVNVNGQRSKGKRHPSGLIGHFLHLTPGQTQRAESPREWGRSGTENSSRGDLSTERDPSLTKASSNEMGISGGTETLPGECPSSPLPASSVSRRLLPSLLEERNPALCPKNCSS